MKKFNKILAVIISVLLILSVVPVSVLADTTAISLDSAYNVTGGAEVTFTPTETALYEVYTVSTDYVGAVINVYTADDTHLGSDECSGDNGNASLILTLVAGTTYKISVDSRFSSEAVYNLYVKKHSDINVIDASLSVPYTVNIDTEGKKVYYKFVPDESNVYRLYASGDYDTHGALYDSSFIPITQNDDAVQGLNFSINYFLQAGETYYICASMMQEYQTGEFIFRIDVATPPEEIDIICTDETDTFYEGEIGNFKCEVAPDDAYGGITWSVIGEEGIVSLGTPDDLMNSCQIEFIRDGITTIKATAYNGVSDTYTITVLDVPVNPISLATEVTVDPSVTGGNAYFSFTPSETGDYVFASSGAYATGAEILEYDENLQSNAYIGSDSSYSKDNYNFKIEVYLQAGVEYLLKVKSYCDTNYKVAIAPETNATDVEIYCKSGFEGTVFQTKCFYAETVPFYAVEDMESDVRWESTNEAVVDIFKWDGEADLEGIGTADITVKIDDTDISDTKTVTVTGGTRITVGETYSTTISEEEGLVVYNFTPETTGKYKFYSVGDYDTNATLYNSDLTRLDYSDDEEDNNFGINVELTAGNTYYYVVGMFSWEDVTTFDVKLEQALSITEIKVITPPDRTEYIEGYFEEHFSIDGVRLEIKWSDGSTDFWSYQTQEEVKGERVWFSAVEENGEGYIGFTCAGYEKKYYVTIIENTIESIELIKPTENKYIENSGGYYTDGMYGEFYYYDTSMPYDAKIRINYTDRESVEAYVGDYVDGYTVEWDNNQYYNPWELGENVTYISYLGKSVSMNVSVVASPIGSIEIINDFEITIMENANGNMYEHFYYDYYYFLRDAVLKVDYKAGGTEYIPYEDWYDIDVLIGDEQMYDPWTVGGENYIIVEYLGAETTIPVNIVENTVDRIVIDSFPVDEITMGDTKYGDPYAGAYSIDLSGEVLKDMQFTVYFTDRESKTYKYSDGYYGEFDGYYLYEYGIWHIEEAGEYEYEFEFMGHTFSAPITVIDNLVEGIEIIKLPNKTDCSGFIEVEGLEIKITYDGGKEKIITATKDNTSYELDDNWAQGTIIAIIKDGGFTVVVREDYETFEGFVAICGIVHTQIDDIEINELSITKVEAIVINPDIDGSKVTVTFEDSSTKELTLEVLYGDADDLSENIVKTELGIHYCWVVSDTENGELVHYMYFLGKETSFGSFAGDVNGDGQVIATDLALLKLYLAGANSNIDLKGADLNGDTEITATDLAILKLYLAGA